jgi:hypothetical protein
MALRKIRKTFYVYFRDLDGRLKTRSLKTTDPALARSLHDDYMTQLQAKKARAILIRDFPELAPPPEPPKPATGVHQRGGIRIADMWDCAIKKRPLSKRHKENWQKLVDGIGVKFADQVTPSLALKFLEDRYGKGNGKTYNNMKSSFNTVFRCCLVEANLTASPFASIINKRVTEVAHHRNLTLEEFALVMKNLPLPLKILAMLSRWTTQRLETCARMTPEMFDFERKVFIIDPGKTRRFKKWVCCPIMPELEEFIKPILSRCKPGKPIVQNFCDWNNHYFSYMFNKILRECGIENNKSGTATFHSIRGTAITWFKEHGIKGEELRSITGHASADVEDIYARDIATISRIAREFDRM